MKNILTHEEMQARIDSGEANLIWSIDGDFGDTGCGIYVYEDTMLYFDETRIEVDEYTPENVEYYQQPE